MDKEFAKKIRIKRIRAAAVALVVIAVVVYLILDMQVEKADYTESLESQIAKAEQLYEESKANTGNEAGSYAPYTLLNFEKQIEEAKTVFASEDSEYNAKKEAYETLKEQTKAFKKDENRDVIDKDQASTLAKEKTVDEHQVDFKGDEKLSYTIDGNLLKNPTTMNLMAREKGPYYDQISEILQELSLSGQVVSFYQEGTFGGTVHIKAPMYSEKKVKAYAYKVDLKEGKLEFVSEASIDVKGQTASFDVSEGGDYVVVTKKMHKDGKKKAVDIKEETAKKADEKSGSGKSESENSSSSGGQSSGGNAPANKPESKKIDVTIEIRCDTLASDLSKLENPALEAYVPANGTILPTTKVTVNEGSTVFDVLNRVCRDKNIQVESTYTPAYGSYYIEGINYLYEFDGGKLSGWMYKVNGWFPNYGCSSYTLKDGDTIVWCYTCDLGYDVGGGNATGG